MEQYRADFTHLPEGQRVSRRFFQVFKPLLKERFEQYLNLQKTSQAGRPRKFDLDIFFEAFFQLVDNGSKISNLAICFPQIAGSFKRYLRLFCQSRLLECLNNQLLLQLKAGDCLTIDSFVVKSCDGKELTGKNYLDRGRKGVKVTIISNLQQIIENYDIFPANKGETSCLESLLEKRPPPKKVTLLGDSGFIGKNIASFCHERQVRLVAKPRQTTPKKGYQKDFQCKACKDGKRCYNGKTCINSKNYSSEPKITHKLSKKDQQLLERERPKIEHINGVLRRFRGINTKFTKRIITYQTIVSFGVLCHNFYRYCQL